jgi:hypothetical protein
MLNKESATNSYDIGAIRCLFYWIWLDLKRFGTEANEVIYWEEQQLLFIYTKYIILFGNLVDLLPNTTQSEVLYKSWISGLDSFQIGFR